LRDPNPGYAGFIAANAESVPKNAQAPDHSLGLVWSGPPGATTAVSQTSAIDALVAALSIRGKTIVSEGRKQARQETQKGSKVSLQKEPSGI
jgi:hypothetical protein